MRPLQPGVWEPLKREWHRALLVLAGGALLYNGAAWIYRTVESVKAQEPPEEAKRRHEHLMLNVCFYWLVYTVEKIHVRTHEPIKGHEPRADLPQVRRGPAD